MSCLSVRPPLVAGRKSRCQYREQPGDKKRKIAEVRNNKQCGMRERTITLNKIKKNPHYDTSIWQKNDDPDRRLKIKKRGDEKCVPVRS